MARWQIIDTKKGKLDEQWDDGETTRPGDEGFATAKVKAYAGAGNFNYIGTPNWTPPPPAPSERIESAYQQIMGALDDVNAGDLLKQQASDLRDAAMSELGSEDAA